MATIDHGRRRRPLLRLTKAADRPRHAPPGRMLLLCVSFALSFVATVNGFGLLGGNRRHVSWLLPYYSRRRNSPLASAAVDGTTKSSSYGDDDSDDVLECSTEAGGRRQKQVSDLKLEILKVAAAHDRGFGAGPRARERAVALIQSLEHLNRETFASRGIDGEGPQRQNHADDDVRRSSSGRAIDELSVSNSPLTGNWRMVWTTAFDVLSLEASPFTKTAAIYQVFDPPTITNVIDVLPKVEAAFPPSLFPSSLLRLQVETIGSSCPPEDMGGGDDEVSTRRRNRILLEFRSVQFRPLQLLGTKLNVFPPLQFELPGIRRITSSATSVSATSETLLEGVVPAPILEATRSLWGGIAASRTDERTQGTTSGTRGGYFDVTYLDEDFLVIRQQGSGRNRGEGGDGIGGLFVLTRVDSIDP